MRLIEVSELRKAYGGRVVVDGVSFSVDRGEIFGVLGTNGAGKTTAVECLQGLRAPDSGTISVLGLDPARDTAELRRRVGTQLQDARLPEKLRVREALSLFASFYPDPADIDALLTRLGLDAHRDIAFGKLSGGLRQRLSIALALVGNPELAILDELTTGLDPHARQETWQLVENVRASGVTVVLVTHFMDEAQRLCDRLVLLDRGRVVATGTPAELLADTGRPNLHEAFVALTRG
ncbi:ABC transporter ATP-binding protein [Amycolatopsis rubida]|uniref:ABC transporter ATP-binding protein n=1 Tax=Amycolatopsis rubida TaxID=112413 RepID=A0A1I5F1D8_9PSEU|nr:MULTISPECIES: ABC transporter ATP-binding protein [Amycolatopsis]MYW94437.1 ATP-binding cassette domain-containing protein [Amycolatopsis rubida]NEC59425.1 ABC transporter ATP-binding protein [Amycolatopsis rubida]OAP27145.1 putative ABC transporter ATP-binding protein YbhF [Amycolatopsis sp. M39]SFO17562.1 ABC-2 type transport system ATP-binding protein [Amycolatopsis rubida]